MSFNVAHLSGFVTIVGLPNAGKSTLLNALVGKRLSIVTHKVQTTRNRIYGMVNAPDYQIIYTDTPGIITPYYSLHHHMMREVSDSILGADILLYIVDVTNRHMSFVPKQIQGPKKPLFLILNKIDLISEDKLIEVLSYLETQIPATVYFPISALHNFQLDNLQKLILKYLPQHPPYYPKDLLTDRPERFFVAETIREKILQQYHQEVPYSVYVIIDQFKEKEKIIYISAIIYVERKSQKAILIGKNGIAIKKVGVSARKSIENFLKKPVFLEQQVKVKPGWKDSYKPGNEQSSAGW